MLDEMEDINIKGYKIIRNDRNHKRGGVLLAVKNAIWSSTVEVQRYSEYEESLWIMIGTEQKIRIGIVYASQESRTTKNKLEEMYRRIKTEI